MHLGVLVLDYRITLYANVAFVSNHQFFLDSVYALN